MKKLIIFMFSIVLLGSCGKEGCTDVYSVDYNADATKDDGSCSDQRIVKFSIERTSSEPTFVYNNYFGNVGGYIGVYLEYDYLGGAGISQVSGEVFVGTTHPNWAAGTGSGFDNNPYNETNQYTMIKNDNVSLNIIYRGIYCDYTGSYVIKAHVGNNEIIIKENYSPPANVGPNPYVGNEVQNWIVP